MNIVVFIVEGERQTRMIEGGERDWEERRETSKIERGERDWEKKERR